MTDPLRTHNGVQPPVTVERLTGRGTVYSGQQRLGDVNYTLTVTPPNLRGVTFEPGNEPKVTPDITGTLDTTLFASEPLVQGVHTLVLADGRAFDFRVIQPDTNEIVGVSWFRNATLPKSS